LLSKTFIATEFDVQIVDLRIARNKQRISGGENRRARMHHTNGWFYAVIGEGQNGKTAGKHEFGKRNVRGWR